MCEHCTAHREEIRKDLIELLTDHPDSRLMPTVEKHLDAAVSEIIEKRITPVIERNPEMEMPDEDEIRAAVKDTLIAAVVATGAASLAANTPSYTDEGGEPKSIILGEWAGHLLNSEMGEAISGFMQHLGMGRN